MGLSQKMLVLLHKKGNKGLGAIRAKIGPTSDVDKKKFQNVFTISTFQK